MKGCVICAAVVKDGASEKCTNAFQGDTSDLELGRERLYMVPISLFGLRGGSPSTSTCVLN